MAGYIGSRASVVSSGAERKKTFDITGTTTSLTGLSYTVNQVHVFHNGVRLVDGTDFTATNGSSITLTSAAESGDEVVVLSYAGYQVSDTVSASQGGTFSGDVTFDGSFTSQGIDDNATSTAITLDTSGNLLVGKASTAFNTAGTYLQPNGLIAATTSSTFPMALNRLSTDGDILSFFKDTSPVGSIGVLGANEFYIDGPSNSSGIGFLPDRIAPRNSGIGYEDATQDIGQSNIRFKDLYLSGGVYLGGTGSANLLDDYETGSWTPLFGDNSTTASNGGGFTATYVKIGKLVTVSADITMATYSGGSPFLMYGLPFVGAAFGWGNGGGSIGYTTTTNIVPGLHVTSNTSAIYFMNMGTSIGGEPLSISGKRFIFSLTYET